jgi:polyisoprenoid-binding protein YceI
MNKKSRIVSKRALIVLASASILGITAWAATANSYAVMGILTYEAKGPTGLFKGANNAVTGELLYDEASNSVKGKICSDQGQWKSGEGIRDGHTRDMFEADKFKTACLEPTSLEGKPGDTPITLNANLTMHGVTKAVVLKATAKPSGDKLMIDGKLAVKLTDYGMKAPNLLGITVANDVNVIVKAEATIK